MAVTNGFLKLSRSEYESLTGDRDAFERRARQYDESDGYLDMDRAGYELAFILDDSLSDSPDPEKQLYRNVASVLSGGNPIHPDLDLGYGPAVTIDRKTIQDAIQEFANLQFQQFFKFASDEIIVDMLMSDVSEGAVQEYHWAYLGTLIQFLQNAVDEDSTVVRY